MGDTDLQSQKNNWQTLKTQGLAGEFKMDSDIGEALRKRCETFATALEQLKDKAKALDHLSGYGTLPSAIALQGKFEQKAAGQDSAVKRIEQHIEVVALMHDAYAAAIGKITQADQSAALATKQQTEEVK
ncbi:hypothetical protein [Nocardia goodfellowii]|uniref:PE domain-containing protein n=1 Tax=Nocardia goodfellowii TaxID=882446 RepID=A0ABS4QS81_9NOCA|nr:hypothetical protein [Nocardia goodfellowii]MBP2193899.1 hypothetical protein [Nocardia goodfellowii]